MSTGNCDLNGEGCTLVEMTLINPKCPGCGSSADISLIPPLAYSVPTSFRYINGCDGDGAACSSSDCRTAFFVPDDNQVQVQCQEDDVDLLISFCPGGSGSTPTKSEMTSTSDVTPSEPASGPQSNVSSPAPTAAGAPTTTSQQEQPTSPATLDSNANLTPGKGRCNKTHAERRALRNHPRGIHRRLNRRAGHRSDA